MTKLLKKDFSKVYRQEKKNFSNSTEIEFVSFDKNENSLAQVGHDHPNPMEIEFVSVGKNENSLVQVGHDHYDPMEIEFVSVGKNENSLAQVGHNHYDPMEIEFISVDKNENSLAQVGHDHPNPMEIEFVSVDKNKDSLAQVGHDHYDPMEIEFISVDKNENSLAQVGHDHPNPMEIEFVSVDKNKDSLAQVGHDHYDSMEIEFVSVDKNENSLAQVGHNHPNPMEIEFVSVDKNKDSLAQVGHNHYDPMEIEFVSVDKNENSLAQVGHNHPNPTKEELINNQSNINTVFNKSTVVKKKPIIRVTTPGNKEEIKNTTKEKTSYFTITQELMNQISFINLNDVLYYFDNNYNYYVPITKDKSEIFIRQNISSSYKKILTSFGCKEIYQWLVSERSLKVDENDLKQKTKYIAFKNCLVNIDTFNSYPHNKELYFTSVINADYPTFHNETLSGVHFESFMAQVTNENKQLYMRIQELFGYVISEIREAKIIPYLIGPKDCGKSIVLKILEILIGENFFTNLSFEELNNKNYLYELYEKKLNTCGETSELTLKKLDTIKKLSGGDYVMADRKYEHPIKFINKAVLIFAGNHLPIIKGIDPSNAFAERLLIFPFSNPVPKEEQDPFLINKINNETSYIAVWALKGLKRLIKNNFEFTDFVEIHDIIREYKNLKTNTVENFITNHCIVDSSKKVHSVTLKEAYEDYCYRNNETPESNLKLHSYCQNILRLNKSKFRIGPSNRNGYLGLGIIKIDRE